MKAVGSNKKSDLELIYDYKNGNSDALGELYQRYMHLIFGSCLNHLKDEEKSQDAVMEIYEHLTKVLHKHEVEHFKSWIYRVTFNHCMQILRKEKRTNEKGKKYQEDQIGIMESSAENHPSITKEDQLIHLEDCIEELKEFQHNCIKLFYLQELCYNEIVEKTGYALKKVKSYIQNGKRNLALCMERKK